jgi:hypothetical protein
MALMTCGCGQSLVLEEVVELDDVLSFGKWVCSACHIHIGGEGNESDVSSLVLSRAWTDEARYQLERLPPYIEPLVRQEVEDYADQKKINVVSQALMVQAQNHGTVRWSPEAEARMLKVPSPVRAMARIELERTAIDRGLPEVGVELMEEIKARYFGMATQSGS